MATTLSWGPNDATTTSSELLTDGSDTPSPLEMLPAETSMTDQSAPPSPSDLSAAAILATLADSRPPTSQGEAMEDTDNDQAGGIELLESFHGDGAGTYAVMDGSISLSTEHFGIDEMLAQHAAALDSLTMEQHPPPPPTSSGPTIQDFLTSHGTIYDLDYEAGLNPNEEYLNHLNTDRFLSISSFYQHFVGYKDNPIGLEATPPPDHITREDLCGDDCDIQGINWSMRRATRAAVRSKRTVFESARLSPQLATLRQGLVPTPDTEDYFSFKRTNTKHRASVPHFQLRNLMTATSRNNIFYADRTVVLRTDAAGTPAKTVMNLTKHQTESGPFQITTLAATDDVLIAGGFEGEYALSHLSDSFDTRPTVGRTPDRSRDSKSHITNHVHLFNSRHNYSPQAVLSSNDNRLRVLDCHSNRFTNSFEYSAAVNCSATSPNGRMRVVVGDFRDTLITNSETGRPFETLKTHTDDVFACDWADDGIHVATAAQDTTIVIWDARMWARPLKTLLSELSIPRCLKFSPVGGGPRVLVSAEADDYVSIFNAQTFESRQVFDFFGRTAGISLTPDGESLFVANSEPQFGGIMEFERESWARARNRIWYDDSDSDLDDWCTEEEMRHDTRVACGSRERERRGLDLGSLIV